MSTLTDEYYVKKLEELYLPPRESFYNSLIDDMISENAYALNVWFSIRTLEWI